MNQKESIYKYLAGFVIGLSCVSAVGYATLETEGGIGVLFNKLTTQEKNGYQNNPYRLNGRNIQDGTVTSTELKDEAIQTEDIKDGTLLQEDVNSAWTFWNRQTNGNIFYGSGNVGINTKFPSEKLQVNGSIKIKDDTEWKDYVLMSDADGKAKWSEKGVNLCVSTGKKDGNVCLGKNALMRNVSGTDNTAIGNLALLYNTTGFGNTGIGNQTLPINTTGSWNVAIGNKALLQNITGYRNTAIGTESLVLNKIWIGNTSIGFSAGDNLELGKDNVFIGKNAGGNLKSGNYNLALWANTNFPDPNGNYQLNIANLIFGSSKPRNKSVTIEWDVNIKKNLTASKITITTPQNSENVTDNEFVTKKYVDDAIEKAGAHGMIAPFYRSNCPKGWTQADGTNWTPDLRGIFIRWYWTNGQRNNWKNEIIKSWDFWVLQSDAIRNITGEVWTTAYWWTVNGVFKVIWEGVKIHNKWWHDYRVDFDASRVVPTTDENRPSNVALLYCMKTSEDTNTNNKPEPLVNTNSQSGLSNIQNIQRVECSGNDKARATCDAKCPSNTILISWGCRTNLGWRWVITENYPVNATTWRCTWTEDYWSKHYNHEINGYALCASLGK